MQIDSKVLAEMLQYVNGMLRYADALSRQVAEIVARTDPEVTVPAAMESPTARCASPSRHRPGTARAVVWQVFEATEEVLSIQEIFRRVQVIEPDTRLANLRPVVSQLVQEHRVCRVSHGCYQRVLSKPHLAWTAGQRS